MVKDATGAEDREGGTTPIIIILSQDGHPNPLPYLNSWHGVNIQSTQPTKVSSHRLY